MFSNLFFFSKMVPFVNNEEKYCAAGQTIDDNKTGRMRVACWITKATKTHTEYAVLIAFRQQQWLRERTLMLR